MSIPDHGVRARYIAGCRCEDCCTANTLYMRRYRRIVTAGAARPVTRLPRGWADLGLELPAPPSSPAPPPKPGRLRLRIEVEADDVGELGDWLVGIADRIVADGRDRLTVEAARCRIDLTTRSAAR